MMPNEEWGLAGKVAIVTGGGAVGDGIGNGRAAAILLARAGSNVLVVDRDLTLAERTVAMIADEGGKAVAACYDLTDSKQCAAMVEDAVSRWGRLDCLDNNVGIGSKGTVVEETEENWARIMHVNVDTMFLACKHAIPAMIRTAGGGSIVNVSSISALRPRGLTAYSVSKGAVIALTKAMAVDHGAQGIRVNCVAPGPVYTPMVYARGMTEQARDTRRDASVLKREGTGWDIGSAVRFLLSDQARYITGQTLVVDGGATLVGPSRASQ
ncbi:MAG TPA: SDR family NAD(P)-dependent oxidoreductase [Acetobacteraceae bacterium]|jgi:NAD(P)-dependent dehydrogenase (short-subunit alcohol dehydrogenase family)|nr:SDR family NAD(P)-dependent oxidoreductase [Acetobacteraceae bacterium]